MSDEHRPWCTFLRSAAAGPVDNDVDEAALAVFPRGWVLFILLANSNGRTLAHVQAQAPPGGSILRAAGSMAMEADMTTHKRVLARPIDLMYIVVAAPVFLEVVRTDCLCHAYYNSAGYRFLIRTTAHILA